MKLLVTLAPFAVVGAALLALWAMVKFAEKLIPS